MDTEQIDVCVKGRGSPEAAAAGSLTLLVSDEEECDGAGRQQKTEATSYPAFSQSCLGHSFTSRPKESRKKVPCMSH